MVIFEAHHSTIARICISHRDNKVATASIKGTIIRIFDLKEFEGKVKVHKVKNLRRGHNLVKVNSLSFHNDNHILGCGSESIPSICSRSTKKSQTFVQMRIARTEPITTVTMKIAMETQANLQRISMRIWQIC